jgi:hypothetical protein
VFEGVDLISFLKSGFDEKYPDITFPYLSWNGKKSP